MMSIPYAAPTARVVTNPALRRVIWELFHRATLVTVEHPAPAVRQEQDEVYRVGLAWLREPQPRLFE